MTTKTYPYFHLKIFIDTNIVVPDVIEKYKENIDIIQKKMELYKSGKNLYMDAGFDLFVPQDINILTGAIGVKIDHGVKCAMTFNETPTAFYLYPRSSTGSKTPLRLSNSVGIIDSGYRGNIIALFDCCNMLNINVSTENAFTNKERLVQICGPNIMYPIYPELIDSIEMLGITERGSGGFGSTGS